MGDWWNHVRTASQRLDGDIDISMPPAMIGGVQISLEDHILLRFQKNKSENRTYICKENNMGKKELVPVGDEIPAPRATVRVDEGTSQKMTFALVDTVNYIWAQQDGFVNALDFGAVPDGDKGAGGVWKGTDNTAAFQRAVDFCIQAPNRQLFIPAGHYVVYGSIIVNIPGGFASLHIFGDTKAETHIIGLNRPIGSGGPVGSNIPTIDIKYLPIFALQGMSHSIIRRIHFEGRNDWVDPFEKKWIKDHPGLQVPMPVETVPRAAMMLDDDIFVTNQCRDTQNSPHAAIVIDPYSKVGGNATLPQDGGYEGHSSYYLHPGNNSSDVLIEDCMFDHFVVGVMIAPRSDQGNAENITIRNCQFTKSKVALAIGGNETRNVVLYNFNVAFVRVAVDCRTYGRNVNASSAGDKPAAGEPPAIYGADITNSKYLFNMTLERALTVQALYCEAVLSLGFIYGTNPSAVMNFVGCTFSVYQPTSDWHSKGRPMIDCHLLSTIPVRFDGCSFQPNAGGGATFSDPEDHSEFQDDSGPVDARNGCQPLMFFNDGALTFASCGFQGNPYTIQQSSVDPSQQDFLNAESSKAASFLVGFTNFHLVHFESSFVLDPRRRDFSPSNASRLSSIYHLSSFDELALNIMPSGAFVMPVENDDENDPNASRLLRVVSHREFPVRRDDKTGAALPVDVQFKITSDGKTANFKTETVGILKPGDLVYDVMPWDTNDPDAPRIKEFFTEGSAHFGGIVGMVIRVKRGDEKPPMDDVTLVFVPERYQTPVFQFSPAPLTMTLKVRAYGRFHSPTHGWSDSDLFSNQILTSKPEAWSVGDRIWAKGYLVPGTHIVAINNGVFTLSRPVIKPLPFKPPFGYVALTDAPIFYHVGQELGI